MHVLVTLGRLVGVLIAMAYALLMIVMAYLIASTQ